jgi:hypothetical protein
VSMWSQSYGDGRCPRGLWLKSTFHCFSTSLVPVQAAGQWSSHSRPAYLREGLIERDLTTRKHTRPLASTLEDLQLHSNTHNSTRKLTTSLRNIANSTTLDHHTTHIDMAIPNLLLRLALAALLPISCLALSTFEIIIILAVTGLLTVHLHRDVRILICVVACLFDCKYTTFINLSPWLRLILAYLMCWPGLWADLFDNVTAEDWLRSKFQLSERPSSCDSVASTIVFVIAVSLAICVGMCDGMLDTRGKAVWWIVDVVVLGGSSMMQHITWLVPTRGTSVVGRSGWKIKQLRLRSWVLRTRSGVTFRKCRLRMWLNFLQLRGKSKNESGRLENCCRGGCKRWRKTRQW